MNEKVKLVFLLLESFWCFKCFLPFFQFSLGCRHEIPSDITCNTRDLYIYIEFTMDLDTILLLCDVVPISEVSQLKLPLINIWYLVIIFPQTAEFSWGMDQTFTRLPFRVKSYDIAGYLPSCDRGKLWPRIFALKGFKPSKTMAWEKSEAINQKRWRRKKTAKMHTACKCLILTFFHILSVCFWICFAFLQDHVSEKSI